MNLDGHIMALRKALDISKRQDVPAAVNRRESLAEVATQYAPDQGSSRDLN
jgi:hypothetical protein